MLGIANMQHTKNLIISYPPFPCIKTTIPINIIMSYLSRIWTDQENNIYSSDFRHSTSRIFASVGRPTSTTGRFILVVCYGMHWKRARLTGHISLGSRTPNGVFLLSWARAQGALDSEVSRDAIDPATNLQNRGVRAFSYTLACSITNISTQA